MFFMQENYFELINTCFLDIWQRNNSELFSWLCNQSEPKFVTNQNQEESNKQTTLFVIGYKVCENMWWTVH